MSRKIISTSIESINNQPAFHFTAASDDKAIYKEDIKSVDVYYQSEISSNFKNTVNILIKTPYSNLMVDSDGIDPSFNTSESYYSPSEGTLLPNYHHRFEVIEEQLTSITDLLRSENLSESALKDLLDNILGVEVNLINKPLNYKDVQTFNTSSLES